MQQSAVAGGCILVNPSASIGTDDVARMEENRQTGVTAFLNSDNEHVRSVHTAPIAATGLIGGFGVAGTSVSRALGGLVLRDRSARAPTASRV